MQEVKVGIVAGDLVYYDIPSPPASMTSSLSRRPCGLGEAIGSATRELTEGDIADTLLSDDLIDTSASKRLVSVVHMEDQDSRCFTRAYGKTVDQSAGSVLLLDGAGLPVTSKPLSEAFHEQPQLFYGKLRRFHPRELLALFGFPASYRFPEGVSVEHQYACIGNSVNVDVVRLVMRLLFDVDL